MIVGSDAKVSSYDHAANSNVLLPLMPLDTPEVDLPYPYSDQSTGDPLNYPNSGGLMLENPSNINTNVEYDPTTGTYIINQTMGGMDYRPPTYMESEEYQNYMFNKQVKSYWDQRVDAETQNNQNNTVIPKLHVGGEVFDRIFGGNTVDIRPNGSAELIFAYNGTKTKNPALPVKQQKISTFDFDEKIQLNVVGKIGDKLKLTTSYNTEATFDFENQMKLEYTGYEDEIIKKIEAGNVNMPLNGSLITGSQTLFGIKTQLQFGRLTITSILSQQKGKKSEVEVTGGAQVSRFEVNGDLYEQNKHYFLGQYFRNTYNAALANLPFVNSQVTINRIEVWVSNTNAATNDIRTVVGFTELGEDGADLPVTFPVFINDTDPTNALPYNGQNDLYATFSPDSLTRTFAQAIPRIDFLSGSTMYQTRNHELYTARKLATSEYTLNTKLGYISLNQQLNPEQALSVAYQYTVNGVVYTVGEFSDGGIAAPSNLFTKLLKSTNTATSYQNPYTGIREQTNLWKLMMKNVYSIGSYQINPTDFKLDVYYNNSGNDINYLPVDGCANITSKPLLQVLNLDKLNQQSDQQPDGVFDFIDGVTINSNNGRVIFPVIEPFGDHLRSKFNPDCNLAANAYVFDQLYDSTRTNAQQFPNLNRYKIKGQYQSSSSSEISLGAPNVPQGSVTVTAGGIQLTENVDYTVDYTLGRVKIINEGILNSGTPIKISLESNALFAIQSKTLFGTHLDYRINKDFTVGGTVMNLTERPLTKKVNMGDEPISNTIWGLDGNYRTEAPFLTRLIDRIPLIETKEVSTITAAAEFAYLVPGHSKAIGKNGNSYIDDFEGSQSTIDLRAQGAWSIASTPQGQSGAIGEPTNLFPEGNLANDLEYGFNRAKLSWYVIDPLFLRQTSGLTPANVTDNMMSNHFMREVPETEVFPNKQSASGQATNIATLDLAYYPGERGPYNYDDGSSAYADGLDSLGNLKNPNTRWGGMMRAIQTNDFEAANVEYIQFWVMDPFNDDIADADKNTSGELYFNIGNVSEDVLRDSYRSSENVLPAPSTAAQNAGQNLPVVPTVWGNIPTTQPLVNAFNSDPGDRNSQDVGLDGLDNAGEVGFFNTFLSSLTPAQQANVIGDPSADDFHYFRGDDYESPASLTTLERYKKWYGLEGNSPIAASDFSRASTQSPNVEDINRDNNLSTVESYYQYHISLKETDFTSGVGQNYITDVYNTTAQNVKDGTTKPIRWYQFKIPLKSPENRVGSIENYQSIRFIRMFFKNVDKPIVMRFARLELVRGEWRRYGFDILDPGLYQPNDDDGTQFDIAAVNIEENGNKQPVNYVLPPGIDREINAASANLVSLNEQSMSLTVCNLSDGKARAAFKNVELDVRQYKKLKMYIHAEASANDALPLNDKDLHLIVRLGTDYNENYYEYEIPMQVTPPGSYNPTSEDDQYRVWPSGNEMILEFSKLQAAKQKRNIDLFNHVAGVAESNVYTVFDDDRRISIRGNPNLSAIRTIMIGVKNPGRVGPGDDDDGQKKCGQIWVNELRLTDFDEKGGWAANARITAKLADFGNLTLSGNMYTPGFGSIENKVAERKRETLKQYDLSSSLELGKFVPEQYNVRIPMFVGYSETFITPQYNPLDPDILLGPTLRDESIPKSDRDSLKHVTQDYTKRRSINFTNVKKDKGKNAKKAKIYDVENFAASYSYNERYQRNVNIEYNTFKAHRGGLIYNYSPTPKNIKPFAKNKLFQPKYLALIKDINFYPMPNKLGFSTDVDREYTEAKNRNTTGGALLILPTYNKRFNMSRNYDLKYDITKGLKLDFMATNEERILEPDGAVTKETRDTLFKRELFDRIKKTQYSQQTNLNYTIPINKIPFLDFTTANVRYSATYNWTHSPLFNTQKDAEGNLIIKDTLGNTITNSQSIQWGGQLNMVTLYNKIPYFKKINQKGKTANRPGKTMPAIKGKEGTPPVDTTKKKEDNLEILEYIARIIMSVKNVNVTYSTTKGTILPGYKKGTQIMGLDEHFAGPTIGFTLGSQRDIREEAEQKGWLEKTASLNSPYVTTYSTNLNIRANVEPFPDLKIELTATRTQATSRSQLFRYNAAADTFAYDNATETGNFSMSYLTYRTSFKDGDANFAAFLNARSDISNRLGAENQNSNTTVNGFALGYNSTSQDVLIPAFLAGYSGKNSNSISTDPLQKIPKPNWRITYDGLSKLEKIKKYFKSFTLSNAYRSTYSIGGYNTNLLYHADAFGDADAFEAVSSVPNNPNFIAGKQIQTVTISEQWSPLVKLDMTLQNSILLTFEYKKDRNLSLGLTSKTVTEVAGREIVGGTGYRIRDVKLGGNLKIKGKPIKSDLNLKVDLSFRKNETVIRRIVEEVSQSTGGTNIISIKVSADYVINDRVNIRAFYDRIINKPVISTSFPTTNTNAGISLRLTLSN
ncbi:MAG: cell surface protein SprA [Bacteroidota bacterium]|nr:cell surface protein SprA [Bacteroidota bacterium]